MQRSADAIKIAIQEKAKLHNFQRLSNENMLVLQTFNIPLNVKRDLIIFIIKYIKIIFFYPLIFQK
jgi:hypothetical protein